LSLTLKEVTNKIKEYPFEVKIKGDKIQGVALSDQVKSLDFKARNFEFIEKAENVVIIEGLYKIKVLLGI